MHDAFSPVIRRGFFFLEPMPTPRIALLRNPHFRNHEVSVYKAPPSSAGRRGLSLARRQQWLERAVEV